MATASVTNTFVNATTADAGEVNTNFTDLVTFLNASVVHVDGSKVMTGVLDTNGQNIDLGTGRIIDVGAGTAASNAARVDDTDEYVTFVKSGLIDTDSVVGTHRFYVQKAHKILEVEASLGVDPLTSSVIVDVNKNGTSVWATTQANRPTITTTTYVDAGGALDTDTLADGDYLTVDVDQGDSGGEAADLTVVIRLRRV